MKRARNEDGESKNVLPLTKKQKIGQESNNNQLFAVIPKGYEDIIFKSNNTDDEFTVSIKDMLTWLKTKDSPIITIYDEDIITIDDESDAIKEHQTKPQDVNDKSKISEENFEMREEDSEIICPSCKEDMQYEGEGFTCDGCGKYFCEYCVEHGDNYPLFDEDSDETPDSYTYCHSCNPNNKNY